MTSVLSPGYRQAVQNRHLEQYRHYPQSKDGTLVMDAITKTFRYLDEEELAAKKKAAQAAEGWKEMRRLLALLGTSFWSPVPAAITRICVSG
jgi:hypothetical protein